MEDETIIKLLFDRNDGALEEISKKYGNLYRSVLKGVLSEESDVEECSNDVLLSAWNSIPPNRPERLSSFLCTLAKRIGIDRVRYNQSMKRNPGFLVLLSELEDCLPDDEPAAPEVTESGLKDALDRFLKELDPVPRILFLRRYTMSESVASLAERFGIKENTVSANLSRTRKKLRKYLKKEGINV